MNTFSHVPPGFRFHPTDEELVDYYLKKKVAGRRIDLDVIKDVDLYKIEPWDLIEICRLGSEEQNEWYFFSHKDKKYPTGTRTNRATAAGFWKATGRDKAIYSNHNLIGMRKTLVFYKGRAPNGQKSDWIMHEYRLETDENGPPHEEGWVVCRVFKKRIATTRKASEHESPSYNWYDDDRVLFGSNNNIDQSPKQNPNSDLATHHHQSYYTCKKELDQLQLQAHHHHHHRHFLELPLLESPKVMVQSGYGLATNHVRSSMVAQEHSLQQSHDQQVTDWRVLDKFVASQLSQEEDNSINGVLIVEKQELVLENGASSTAQIDMWK